MVDHILEHPRCAIWAGMGLGKTSGVLTALSHLGMTEDVFPALVIGPLRVAREVWSTEAERWDCFKDLPVVPIVGTPQERLRAVKCRAPIFTTNYEQLGWLVEHWGEDRWPYKTVIADEATRLKNYRGSYRTSSTGKVFLQGAGGVRARALGKVAHSKVKRFIELTGTPASNGLEDLWGACWYLDAGTRLGRTYEGFKQRFFRPKYNGFGVEILQGADKEIHARLKDICLTIDAADYFDIREPIVTDLFVDIPPVARKHYKEMEKEMFAQLSSGDTIEAFGAAAKTSKCLQLASGSVYVDATATSDSHPKAKQWRAVHDAKLEALESVIEEANGAAVLVAYEFRSDLSRILKAHPKAVDLGTADGMRKFKAGESAIGVGHPASIGHGVDGLQLVCNIAVFYGHNWSLELYDQLLGRIGPVRQLQAGFNRPVFVHNILARDTIDELVVERRASKRDVQDILLDAMKRRKQ